MLFGALLHWCESIPEMLQCILVGDLLICLSRIIYDGLVMVIDSRSCVPAVAIAQGVRPDQIIFTDVAAKNLHIRRSALADLFLDS